MSDLESTFAFQLRAVGIPFEQQFRIPGRRFRWDFKVGDYLIEIQGGVWMDKSGHNTGRSLKRDYEKANFATMNKYHTLFFTADDVTSGQALKVIEGVRE